MIARSRNIQQDISLYLYVYTSRVVLDREILPADHSDSQEPLAAELLSSTLRRDHPFNRDTVVFRILLSDLESIARDGNKDGFLVVENSGWRIHSETSHYRRLESPIDTASRRVDLLDMSSFRSKGARRFHLSLWLKSLSWNIGYFFRQVEEMGASSNFVTCCVGEL